MIFSKSFKRQMEKELENLEKQESTLEGKLEGVKASIAKIRETLAGVVEETGAEEPIPASALATGNTESQEG